MNSPQREDELKKMVNDPQLMPLILKLHQVKPEQFHLRLREGCDEGRPKKA